MQLELEEPCSQQGLSVLDLGIMLVLWFGLDHKVTNSVKPRYIPVCSDKLYYTPTPHNSFFSFSLQFSAVVQHHAQCQLPPNCKNETFQDFK